MIPSQPSVSRMRSASRFAAVDGALEVLVRRVVRLREWLRGITSAWPRVQGLMSMNAIVCSSSWTISAGSSPATILQKMQSSRHGRAAYSQPDAL